MSYDDESVPAEKLTTGQATARAPFRSWRSKYGAENERTNWKEPGRNKPSKSLSKNLCEACQSNGAVRVMEGGGLPRKVCWERSCKEKLQNIKATPFSISVGETGES